LGWDERRVNFYYNHYEVEEVDFFLGVPRKQRWPGKGGGSYEGGGYQ
jgi:hypothetical protein